MPRNQIRVTTNLGKLAEDIGTYLGMADGIEQKVYMREMMQDAHEATVPDFVRAAGLAVNQFNFNHMYEYGVTGVTRGDKRMINRNAPSARLWTDVMIGTGRNQLITFIYRPALVRVPKHTEEDTGVDQEILDQLKLNKGKRYVFQHKAEVTEEGQQVRIRPLGRQGVIFVPLQKEAIPASTREWKRGYAFRKSVIRNPGRDTDAQGQFSFFFFDWWSSIGGDKITEYMQRQVTADIERTQAAMGRNEGDMRTPAQTNIKAESKAARGKTRKQWTISARRERVNGIDEREVIA